MLSVRTFEPLAPAHPSTPTLVLVHGFLGAGRNLGKLAQALHQRLPALRLCLPDLPGHGLSGPLGAGDDLPAVAMRVWEGLKPLGGEGPVHLAGHSLGGRVVLAMAQQAGELAARLQRGRVCLLDINAGAAPHLVGPMQALFTLVQAAPATSARREDMRDWFVEHGVERSLADWVVTNVVRTGEQFSWRIDRAQMASFHAEERSCDLWPVVEALGPRCWVVRGGSSGFVDNAEMRRLSAVGAQVATLPGAGHFLHVDAPEGLVDWLVGALTAV